MYENQALPETAENIDLLIVMGGPQSPATTQKECPHFNAKAEITLIQKCIKSEKAVIGVCLGSQLIGEALGANFEHSPEKEIGVFPIQLTDDGLKDEKINGYKAVPFILEPSWNHKFIYFKMDKAVMKNLLNISQYYSFLKELISFPISIAVSGK